MLFRRIVEQVEFMTTADQVAEYLKKFRSVFTYNFNFEFILNVLCFSNLIVFFVKYPPTMWWCRLIVFAESARRRRHLFLLSLENPYSDYFQIFAVCILAMGNLSGNFFSCVFKFLQQNPRWPPKSYGAR